MAYPAEKREEFINQLLAGEPVAEIAKDLGIGERTLWRWKAEPEIAAAIKERHAELVDAARLILLSAVCAAATTMKGAVERTIDVTTAQYKAAYDLLTTHGLIGENAKREAAPAVDDVKFMDIGVATDGKVVELGENKFDPQSEVPGV